jgi:regulator of sigma E protease
MAGESEKTGFLNLLFFATIINFSLGIINLFPIPILDGGQILLLIIEKIRGKPLKPEHINFIYIIGLALIIMIFIVATYQDILRIFVK